jgi:hypothetical protein
MDPSQKKHKNVGSPERFAEQASIQKVSDGSGRSDFLRGPSDFLGVPLRLWSFNRKVRKKTGEVRRVAVQPCMGRRDARMDIQPVNEGSLAAEPSKKMVPTTML